MAEPLEQEAQIVDAIRCHIHRRRQAAIVFCKADIIEAAADGRNGRTRSRQALLGVEREWIRLALAGPAGESLPRRHPPRPAIRLATPEYLRIRVIKPIVGEQARCRIWPRAG